ncbi:MAG: hypothetical protein ACLVJ6_18210, partial [Merdibacter sp.]
AGSQLAVNDTDLHACDRRSAQAIGGRGASTFKIRSEKIGKLLKLVKIRLKQGTFGLHPGVPYGILIHGICE